MFMGWARAVSVFSVGAVLVLCCRASPQTAAGSAVQDHTVRAEHDLQAHDLAGAEHEYREILAADPLNSEAWTGLGVLLYGTGRTQMAAEALRKALSIHADAPRAVLFLALSQADQGQCKDAEPVLAREFERQPVGNLQRITGLALLSCSADAASPVQAVQTVTRLKQLYPDDPDVLYESAELFTRLWNQSAGELLAKHPESYRVHELAGEVFEAQNNYDQAIREYSLALQRQPNVPQLHYRIGQLYLRKGDPDADDRALAEFQQEKKINPQSPLSDLAMADIEMHRRDLDAAKPLYEQAAQLDPSLVEARIGLAKILLQQNQTEAAVAQLNSITAAHPDNAAAHYVLMTAYRREKKMEEAAAELASFNRLQRQRQDSFQDRLDALLNGKAPAAEPAHP